MNNEKIEYTDTDSVQENVKAVPNRKARRFEDKQSRHNVVEQEMISDEERAFRNRKNKLAKQARKRNR